MLRSEGDGRTTFAGGEPAPAASAGPVRQSAARPHALLARLLVAPFLVLAAAAAGLVFAVLLPICGIATIAESIAKAAWRFVRETFAHLPHLPPRRI
jgi:hypothetical protein